MQEGRAPIGLDGQPLELHHTLQTMDSPIAEVMATFHEQHTKTIHINPSSMGSGIDRAIFDSWRKSYWRARARDFAGAQ